MRVACPVCHAEYNIDERRVPAGGLNVRCPKCQKAFPVRRADAAVPLPESRRGPPAAAPSSVPLPQPEAPAGATLAFPSPFAAPPPPAAASPFAPPPPAASPPVADGFEARATLQFSSLPSPFASPAPAAPEPDLVDVAGRATLQFPSPFAAPTAADAPLSDSPFSESPFGDAPFAAPAAVPATPAAPLGFGEVELAGTEPEPTLGDAGEPFPFETPAAAASEPASAPDPFSAGAAALPDLDPFPSPAAAPPARPPPLRAEPAAPPAGLSALGALGPRETEELEALFDEPAARKPAAAARPQPVPPLAAEPAPRGYRVRRRSGRVFGPFPEAEIVEMLSRGELLGNEEVSAEGAESFGALGTIPAFAAAVRSLPPAPLAADAPAPPLVPPAARTATLRRAPGPGLAALVARLRERVALPRARVAIPLALLAALLAVGAGAAATPYGLFFHRAFTGQLGANRPGAKLLAKARLELADDDAGALARAVDLADGALRLDGRDREARAVHAYAASALRRRHGGAAQAWPRAQGYLAELAVRTTEDPDAAKAALSASLAPGEKPADAAAAALTRLLEKSPRDEDALKLLGEAALARGDLAGAGALFARLDSARPTAARGAYALATVALRKGDDAAARPLLERALQANPRHALAAIALGAVAERAGDAARAEALARGVLAAERAADA
ncbi:MAG: zinc-ribbon domain-containing protein, partial [Anaeromyxobacteraceae bacterium]